MRDDFSKNEAMKRSGCSPQEVFCTAKRDGIDTITMFGLVRSVFSFDLVQAKEVIVRGEQMAATLAEYQDGIADALELEFARSSDAYQGR